MPTIILPLGVIVDTDIMRSVRAFQALADEHSLGINIQQSLPKLAGLFNKFKAGELTESEFETNLISAVADLVSPANKAFLQTIENKWEDWQTSWKLSWRICWNEMCVIDGRAIILAKVIADNPDIKFQVYSETNPTHFTYIVNKLKEAEAELANVYSTFELKLSINDLLKTIFMISADDIKAHQCLFVLANISHIKDPFAHAEATKKYVAICNLLVANDIENTLLGGKHMTVDDLERFIRIARQLNHETRIDMPSGPRLEKV